MLINSPPKWVPHTDPDTYEAASRFISTSPTHSAQASSGWEMRSSRPKMARDSNPGTAAMQTAFSPPIYHFPKWEEQYHWREEKVPLYKIIFAGPVKTKMARQRAEIGFLSIEICYVTTKVFIFVYEHSIQFSYRPTQYPSEGGIFLWVKIFGGQNNRKMSHLSKRNKKSKFFKDTLIKLIFITLF